MLIYDKKTFALMSKTVLLNKEEKFKTLNNPIITIFLLLKKFDFTIIFRVKLFLLVEF
jgi:hypothetical protein